MRNLRNLNTLGWRCQRAPTCWGPTLAEHGRRVGEGLRRGLGDGQPSHAGHCLQDAYDPRRFVASAALGCRRQVRTVGLHQPAVRRDRGGHGAQRLGARKRHDARERHVEAARHGRVGQRLIAREAVEDAARPPGSGRVEHLERVGIGLPRVDHDRQVTFDGQRHLPPEDLALHRRAARSHSGSRGRFRPRAMAAEASRADDTTRSTSSSATAPA